ncbi:MAG: transglutaminaseTgpA domain-containing protein, partial [Rubripirellula sp.]
MKSNQPDKSRDPQRVYWRLKLYFATLTALGGLVLSASSDTQSIPIIAVFFAIVGFVFVDWLQLFALPPIAAYAAMAVAALYCVSDFADLDAPGNHQMVAVAQLLVFVQAILMMQRKTRRIFEQLGVFCLLELIVAAVFNNAITYGLLLIPIGIVGAWALCLLAAVSASEGLETVEGFADNDSTSPRRSARRSTISVSAPDSAMSLASTALRLPRVALLSLSPAVLLVGFIFFYALPRTTDASRVSNKGNALVGFSPTVQLKQLGSMLQNTAIALRIYVTDRATGEPYKVLGNMYLRGIVLERYTPRTLGGETTSSWVALPLGSVSGAQKLPREYFPKRNTDSNFYDVTNFSVICESMNANSLFIVAPYHQTRNNREVIHKVDRWTIGRRFEEDWGAYPRTNYEFGTHAFHNGVQSELLARFAEGEAALAPEDSSGEERADSAYDDRGKKNQERELESYIDALKVYDIDAIPAARRISDNYVMDSQGYRRNDYMIAKALERYLSTSGEFSYTLDLNAEQVPGLDPIEQFLTVDKRGHCQFYASALVMMLRSQGIPARMVLGYNTDEFNELGDHYVARQLHAHAWVEALIERDQLNQNRNIYGQPESRQYWLRLDPTPV